MLLSLFLILLGLAGLLVALGYAASESSYAIVGFAFLFVLSTTVLLFGGSLEHVVGVNTTTTYNYDDTNLTLSTVETVRDHYQSYSSGTIHFYGVWLAIIAAMGIVISIVELRQQRRPDDD